MGLVEREAGIDERGNHQPVPIRQYLVVEPRPDPPGAGGEQLFAHGREPFLILYAAR